MNCHTKNTTTKAWGLVWFQSSIRDTMQHPDSCSAESETNWLIGLFMRPPSLSNTTIVGPRRGGASEARVWLRPLSLMNGQLCLVQCSYYSTDHEHWNESIYPRAKLIRQYIYIWLCLVSYIKRISSRRIIVVLVSNWGPLGLWSDICARHTQEMISQACKH